MLSFIHTSLFVAPSPPSLLLGTFFFTKMCMVFEKGYDNVDTNFADKGKDTSTNMTVSDILISPLEYLECISLGKNQLS